MEIKTTKQTGQLKNAWRLLVTLSTYEALNYSYSNSWGWVQSLHLNNTMQEKRCLLLAIFMQDWFLS